MRKMFIASLLVGTALAAQPAQAATLYTDLGAWQADAGSFNRDTNYGSNFSDISSLVLDDGTSLSFSGAANIRTIGSGWGTWSGGYTDQVLYTNGATSFTFNFVNPVGGFGLFAEPNPFDLREFSFVLSDGSSTSASYHGSAGAGFLGFLGSGITSVTVSSDVDFAVGDFYTTAAAGGVPEPTTWAMMILGFGVVGASMRRKKARVSYSMA